MQKMARLLTRLLRRATYFQGTLSTSAAVVVIGILVPCVLILNVAASEATTDVTEEMVTWPMTTTPSEGRVTSPTEQSRPLARSADSKKKHSYKEKSDRRKFRELIPEDYSIHDPPPLINGKPVPVRFSVSIKNIPDLNELKQMLSVEMNLRIYWQDTRLASATNTLFQRSKANHTYLSQNPVVLSDIWVPDIYTDYAKSVTTQRILSPPTSLRIYPNATIRYSSRIMMEMSCPMEFRMYPGDCQRCKLSLESYGFTRKELSFSWIPEGKAVNLGHRLAHFDFEANLMNDREDVNFPSGSYPAISICLKFQRRLNYHLLQTYIPSGLFVVVSWVSFLVPRECAPGRLAICMTTLLTLTAMFAAVRQNTPSVSYIKALDIWMVGCIIFVFFALAEFASVLRLDKHLKVRERKQKKSPSTQSDSKPNCTGEKSNWVCVTKKQPAVGQFRFLSEFPEEQGTQLRNKKIPSGDQDRTFEVSIDDGDRNQKHRRKYKVTNETTRRRIEFISAIIAPTGFIIFNLIYWPWLLLTPTHSSC